MTAKIIPFTPKPVNPSTPPAAPDMQTRVATALDLTRRLLLKEDIEPDCFFLMYGTHDTNTHQRVWRYLSMEFTEAELQLALKQIYADMRRVPG